MKFRGNLQKRAVSVILAIAMVMGCTFNTAAAESGASEKEPQEVTRSYDSGNVTMTNALKGDSDEYTVNLKIKIKNISKFPSAKSLAAAGVDAAATDQDEGDTTPAVNDDPQDTASSVPAVSSQPETASSGEAPVVSEPVSSDTDDTASQPALTAAAKTAAVKAPADETTVDSEDNDEPEDVTSSVAPDTSVESAEPESENNGDSVASPAPEEEIENEEPAQQEYTEKESEPEEPESYEVRYYIPAGFSLKAVPDNAAEEDGYVSFADLSAEDLQSFSADLQFEPTGEEEKDSQGTGTEGQSGLYVDGTLLFAFGETLAVVEEPTVNRTVSLDNWDNRTYNVDLSITATSQLSTGTKPCDIILVLDRSGSMGENYGNISTPIYGVPRTDNNRPDYYIPFNGSEKKVSYSSGQWSFSSSSITYEAVPSSASEKPGDYHQLTTTKSTSFYYYVKLTDGTYTTVRYYNPSGPDGSDWYYTENGTRKRLSSTQSVYSLVYQFYGHSKMVALQAAAKDFVDSVAAKSPDSKIAVVSFASKSKDTWGNPTEQGEVSKNTGLLSVGSDTDSIKEAIDGLKAEGGTRSDLGLEMARGIFDDDDDYKPDDRDRVVIMFTDGVPTNNSSFENDVAASAINQAAVLKGNYGESISSNVRFPNTRQGSYGDAVSRELGCGAAVYTIGLFSGLDSDMQKLVGDYMTQVALGADKYLKPSEDLSLDDIFGQISHEVGGIPGATVTDVIDPRFDIVNDNDDALAAGATVTDDENNTAGTVGYTTSHGKTYWTITWDTGEIPVNEDKSPGWVTSYRVRAKPQFVGGNNIPTNTDDANVVYTADGGNVPFAVQSVNVKPRFFVKSAETTLFYGEDPALNTSFPYPYTTDSYDVIDGIPQGAEITGNGVFLGMDPTGGFSTAWTPLNNAPLVGGMPSIEAFDPRGASDSNLGYTARVTFDPDYDSTDGDQADDNTGDRHAEDLSVDGTYNIHVKTGTLVITKTLDATSSADPNPYFTFKIERFSSNDYTGTPLCTSYQVVYTNDKSGSATIDGLPCGYYRVTEIPNSGWRYTQDGLVQYDSGQQYLGRASDAGATPPTFNQSISATVRNTLGNPYWISGKDSVQNSIRVTVN
jgi:Mg-chelatase subunit ChlD